MWFSVLTHTHTYTCKSQQQGDHVPNIYAALSEWASRAGVDAVGMGSPYTRQTAVNHLRYDGPDRDQYYAPGFDRHALLAGDDIAQMLRQANQAGGGKTLFYLDNETPKARYGHLWWVGYRRDVPEWHDYDQPFDRWMVHEQAADDCSPEPMPYERRPYLQILSIQRAGGALGFWAHPTSWWRGERGQFITNLATEMPAHAIAEGSLDGMVVMGYHAFRPQYLALWHELLDRGFRVPAVAEEDCGLSEPKLLAKAAPLLTYIHRTDDGSPATTRMVVEGFRSGRMFASNGPLVDLVVDGQPMGQSVRTSADLEHDVEITVRPAPQTECVARVELLGFGGKVLWHRDRFPGGVLKLSLPGINHRGYLIARVFGDRADCPFREVLSFAVSNPVYLHPPGTGFTKPTTTNLIIRVREGSPLLGGEIRFETMDGELLSTTIARVGEIREEMPAGGRITTLTPDGKRDTSYLINANKKLQDVQRYLYRGQFLRDFPSLTPGECPPEAWRIDDYVAAMREVELSL